MAIPENKEWKAQEDQMPPNPPGPTLHVSGKVMTSNGGIVPILKPASPQGINPSILILDLSLSNTGNPGTTDMGFRDAKFEQDVTEGQYTQVDIHYESDSIAVVDVEIVV